MNSTTNQPILMDETIAAETKSWIEEAIESEKFSDFTIELTGKTEKTEGYAGDIIFAKVVGKCENGQDKVLDLVVKTGKRNKELREKMMRAVYEREVYVYNKVFPTLDRFQSQKNVANRFDAVPRCYKTLLLDEMEVIVLENLKPKGYSLHPRRDPMNLQHIHLVLKNYAKFHALSLALRDQNEELFNNLTADYPHVNKKFYVEMDMTRICSEKVIKNLLDAGCNDFAERYKKLMNGGEGNAMLDILDKVPKEYVITHGDCHNNNFIFQYKDNDRENPLRVAILDWQISGLHSPVLDLSYFLYSAAPKEWLSQLEILLKFYHAHLTDFLKELGSNADEVFPYNTLVEHWKQYSMYGFATVTFFLEFLYVEKEDAPSLDDYDGGDIKKMFDEFRINDLYLDRFLTVVDNYFNHNLK